LNNCTLSDNSANGYESSGGGAAACTLYNCTLTGNEAFGYDDYGDCSGWGGGAHYSTLKNCMLTGNSANSGGGGLITAP